MICIFCLEERAASEEHVFSLAIGGRLTTDRVCKPCNDVLGGRVDSALTTNMLIEHRRAQFGLAGQSGKSPKLHDRLTGVKELAGRPGKMIESRFDEATGTLKLKAVTSVRILENGMVDVFIDPDNIDDLPRFIQEQRRRKAMPPASREELDRIRNEARKNGEYIANPRVSLRESFDFSFLRHAMLKIAYELAFLWLGEEYLGDPSAAELRTAILSTDPSSTDRLPAYVSHADGFAAFNLWTSDKGQHLAYAIAGDDGIGIAIRVFDIYAAFVWVAQEAARYLSGSDAEQKLRFLAIDPASGTMRESSYIGELTRMSAAMVAVKREAGPL